MLEVPFIPLAVEDVGVGTERLHEALGGTVPEEFGDGALFGYIFPEIEELFLFFLGVIEVGVVEQGGEIVLLASQAQALEVNEPGLLAVENDVLGLEVAMDEVAVGGPEIRAEVDEGTTLTSTGKVFSMRPITLSL